jgi:hypothetical protein
VRPERLTLVLKRPTTYLRLKSMRGGRLAASPKISVLGAVLAVGRHLGKKGMGGRANRKTRLAGTLRAGITTGVVLSWMRGR